MCAGLEQLLIKKYNTFLSQFVAKVAAKNTRQPAFGLDRQGKPCVKRIDLVPSPNILFALLPSHCMLALKQSSNSSLVLGERWGSSTEAAVTQHVLQMITKHPSHTSSHKPPPFTLRQSHELVF